jgi:hypothetical protein
MTRLSESTVAPNLTARISTTNRNGMERKTSTIRIRAESTSPPTRPETAPNSVPITMATNAAKKPIYREAWPPFMIRPSSSKPLVSVPSR